MIKPDFRLYAVLLLCVARGTFATLPSAASENTQAESKGFHRGLIPGGNDDRRWAWLSANMKVLCMGDRQTVAKILGIAKLAPDTNEVFFRITGSRDPYTSSYYRLHVTFDTAKVTGVLIELVAYDQNRAIF
jgi:hypothetical protein